jgi:cytochrome oxidase assembly protein ShyY1
VQAFRLAFTRRWLGIFLFTTVFAAASVALGEWQFDRREYAQQQIRMLDNNYDLVPGQIDLIIGDIDDEPAESKWRSVELTGEYLDDATTYVRNRVKQGTIGLEQLVPFELVSGEIVIVDRGWVPADDKYENPRVTPETPDGEVTVIARLYPDEPVVDGRSAPEGQIATINADTFAETLDAPVYKGLYGQLVSETPMSATGSLWSRPLLDEGPHLSYALQWYVFALMGYFGYGWALVTEARGDAPKNPNANRRPKVENRTDEDVEDAAIDAVKR